MYRPNKRYTHGDISPQIFKPLYSRFIFCFIHYVISFKIIIFPNKR